MKNIVKDGMGFDVKFIKWDELINIDIDIDIELNESIQKIFNQIKARNFMIDDFQIIKDNINKTNNNYIIKK